MRKLLLEYFISQNKDQILAATELTERELNICVHNDDIFVYDYDEVSISEIDYMCYLKALGECVYAIWGKYIVEIFTSSLADVE